MQQTVLLMAKCVATQPSMVWCTDLDQKVMNVRYQYDDSYTQYSVDFNKLNDGHNYTIKADLPDLFGDISSLLEEGDGVMGQHLAK